MSASSYTEKLVQPNDQMLTCDLADTKIYLDKICTSIDKQYVDFKPDWKFTIKNRVGC